MYIFSNKHLIQWKNIFEKPGLSLKNYGNLEYMKEEEGKKI